MTNRPDTHHNKPGPGVLRLFIAIPLPDDILAQVGKLSENLQKGFRFAGCQMSWTSMETMHLTLVFLGSRASEQVEPIGRAMREIASGFAPPRLEIKRLGVFPHWRNPRVLWAGIRDRSHQLVNMHKALEQKMSYYGYEPEGREYNPHLTLARFRSLKGAHSAEKIVQDHTAYKFGPFLTPQMILYKSTLDPKGAQHTALQRVNFERPPEWAVSEAGEQDEES